MTSALERMRRKWPMALNEDFCKTVVRVQSMWDEPGLGLLITLDDQVFALGTDKDNVFGLGSVCNIPQLNRVRQLCDKKIRKFVGGFHPHKTHYFILALTGEGKIYAWGANQEAQLGNNTLNPSNVPELVGGDLADELVTDIACGNTHSMALTADGRVYTWGSNWRGKSAHGTDVNYIMMPKRVESLADSRIVAIASNEDTTVFLDSEGKVFTCGYNNYGHLGSGDTTDRNRAKQVKALADYFIEDVKCGKKHTLALTNTGLIFAWGENGHGQLGDGTTTYSLLPKKINFTEDGKFDKRIMAIIADWYYSKAIDTEGFVHFWGLADVENVVRPAKTAEKRPKGFTNELARKPDNVVANLEAALDDEETSDFVILVENKEILVHKAILRIRSEHFKKLFKDWKNDEDRKMTVKNYSYEVYRAFLKYVYTGKLDDVTCENGLRLLNLADGIQDQDMKTLCEYRIRDTLTFENVASAFSLAVDLDQKGLVDFCVKFAMRGMDKVVKSQAFNEIKGEHVKSLLKKSVAMGQFARY